MGVLLVLPPWECHPPLDSIHWSPLKIATSSQTSPQNLTPGFHPACRMTSIYARLQREKPTSRFVPVVQEGVMYPKRDREDRSQMSSIERLKESDLVKAHPHLQLSLQQLP